MQFKNHVLFLGVVLGFAFSELSYSGDVKVPQYLTNTQGLCDADTRQPFPHQVKSIELHPTDPQVLVFALAKTTGFIELRLANGTIAKYLKDFIENSETSQNLVFTRSSDDAEDSASIEWVIEGAPRNSPLFLKNKFQELFKRHVLVALQPNLLQDNLLILDEWIRDFNLIFSLNYPFGSSISTVTPKSVLGDVYRSAGPDAGSSLAYQTVKESVMTVLKQLRSEQANRYALENQQKATERHRALVAAAENCNGSEGRSWNVVFGSALQAFSMFRPSPLPFP